MTGLQQSPKKRKKDIICAMFEDMNKHDIAEVVKYGFDYIDDVEQFKSFINYLRDQV